MDAAYRMLSSVSAVPDTIFKSFAFHFAHYGNPLELCDSLLMKWLYYFFLNDKAII